MTAKTHTLPEKQDHEQAREQEQKKNQGYTLAFDASTPILSFCLWEGVKARVQWSSRTTQGKKQDKKQDKEQDKEQGKLRVLAEDLPALLARETRARCPSFSYRLLQRICFVRGPGSYTGLRVSLSFARGLRLSCRDLRLFSLTGFEAGLLSLGVAERRGRVLSLVESFHDAWYGQLFEGGEEAVGQARVLDDDGLRLWVFDLLEATRGVERLQICGSGARRACAEVLGGFDPQRLIVNAREIETCETETCETETCGMGACEFSRPLIEGRDGMYAQSDAALKAVYVGAAV